MGKNKRDRPERHHQKNRDDQKELTQRPFGELRGMKVGPSCLHCGEPVNTTLGARSDQRQGYIHNKCLKAGVEKAQALSSLNDNIKIVVRDEKTGECREQVLSLIQVVEGFEHASAWLPTMTAEEIAMRVRSAKGE